MQLKLFLLIFSIIERTRSYTTSNQCIAPGSTLPCSGRGFCIENECFCFDRPNNPHQVVSGRYCECDNLSCLRVNHKMCSGPKNGECICNKCACKLGWTGEGCECPISMDTCISAESNDQRICSNRGICVCGECRCDDTFTGQFCQNERYSYWDTRAAEADNDNSDLVELLF